MGIAEGEEEESAERNSGPRADGRRRPPSHRGVTHINRAWHAVSYTGSWTNFEFAFTPYAVAIELRAFLRLPLPKSLRTLTRSLQKIARYVPRMMTLQMTKRMEPAILFDAA